jgi:hypothetical protein
MTEVGNPGIRAGHAQVSIPKFPGFLVFGGFLVQEFSTLNNDLWVFCCTEKSIDKHTGNNETFKKGKWLKINPGKHVNRSITDLEESDSFIPLPRDFCELSVIGGDLVLYGGRCNDSYRQAGALDGKGLFQIIFGISSATLYKVHK